MRHTRAVPRKDPMKTQVVTTLLLSIALTLTASAAPVRGERIPADTFSSLYTSINGSLYSTNITTNHNSYQSTTNLFLAS